MQAGDIIELEITSQGMNGEGVGRYEGKVVFVPYTLSGERALVKVKHVKKSFIQASVVKLLVSSPSRVKPPCDKFFKCGGCDLMHVDEAAQRAQKIDEYVNNMKKIGGIDIYPDEFIDSDIRFGYRNKVQLPFGIEDGKAVVGYYVNNTHTVVPCAECLLHGEWANEIVRKTLDYANGRRISVYDENTGRGLLRHLVMRRIGQDISVVLVINGEELPYIAEFADSLGENVSLHISSNTKRTNVIMGDGVKLIKGKEKLTADILGVKACVSPQSFMQINDNVRDKLYSKAMELIDKSDICVDLYSGIGITSNILAKNCDRVYSIEIVKSAVEDAKIIAAQNGNADKITAICADAAVELPKLVERLKERRTHYMRLEEQYGTLIERGIKRYEFRMADEKRKKIRVGDIIAFDCGGKTLRVRVTELVQDKNCGRLYNKIIHNLLPSADSELAAEMRSLYGNKDAFIEEYTDFYREKIKKGYEFLAIGIELLEEETGGGYTVLIDPPRKGADERVLSAISEVMPDKIVYISCNHATLARDIALLNAKTASAYHISYNALFDMFPNTHHVETLVVLSKKNPDSHINIDVEFGENEGQFSLKKIKERADERKPKEKVTYKKIQDYIEKTYGFKVHTAYIAEVKRDVGLPMYDAPNAVEELKRPRAHPAPRMVEAIKETLKYFEII